MCLSFNLFDIICLHQDNLLNAISQRNIALKQCVFLYLNDGWKIFLNTTGLPEKLKGLRFAIPYKQVDAAFALGIVRQTYSHYENGNRTPDSEMLYKIEAFYNISVNDLIQHMVMLDLDVYHDFPQPTESGVDPV